MFLDPPLVRVSLKPGAWVEPTKMTRAIRDAGFTPVPEEVSLTVTGTLESREGRFVLVLDHMVKPMEVACIPAPDGDAPEAALRTNLGKTVEIEGLWLFDGRALRVEKMTIQPGSVVPPKR